MPAHLCAIGFGQKPADSHSNNHKHQTNRHHHADSANQTARQAAARETGYIPLTLAHLQCNAIVQVFTSWCSRSGSGGDCTGKPPFSPWLSAASLSWASRDTPLNSWRGREGGGSRGGRAGSFVGGCVPLLPISFRRLGFRLRAFNVRCSSGAFCAHDY